MKAAKDNRPFSQKHPKLNIAIALFILLALIVLSIFFVYFIIIGIGKGVTSLTNWLSSITANLDAVIIVALITGSVSITGVIFSSIVSKSLEYRQKRREYLYQKREEPYSDFVEVVYKIQQKSKGTINYPEKEMLEDMYKFSRKLTLWGSNNVIKKWLKFRENSNNNISGTNTLFIYGRHYV